MMLGNVKFNLVTDMASAGELMSWLGKDHGGYIAFDTETTGLSPETDTVRLFQVGNGQEGWAVPFQQWKGLVEELVNRWQGGWIAHNATFDTSMLDAAGIHIPKHKVEDTRFMSHIINPQESTALKAQAALHIDRKAVAAQRNLDALMSSSGFTWATVPIVPEGPYSMYWIYGAMDTILTYRLWELYKDQVAIDAPRAYDIELSVSWVTNAMERRGAKVDRDYTAKNQESFLKKSYQNRQWLYETYQTSPGSRKGVLEAFEREGVPLTAKTDKGTISLDKKALEPLKHPLAQGVLRHRKYEKITNTYLENFLKYSERDGFIHPSINVIGGSNKTVGESGGDTAVKTSRMSMSGPNLQNLPRPSDEELASVRNSIVPREETNSLLTCDFDQVEMRILAHSAGDEGLRNAFKSDLDFFVALARNIYKDDSIVKSDPRRTGVKGVGYAKVYGSGLEKLAYMMGSSVEEAQRVSSDFDRIYPGAHSYGQRLMREGQKRLREEGLAYVRSPLTGRKYVDASEKLYPLKNYSIQGPAAELLKMKILELDAAGVGEFMILPVHDEIILDVPDDQLHEVAQIVHDVMNDDRILSVPLTAGLATGKRWGEKKDYEL